MNGTGAGIKPGVAQGDSSELAMYQRVEGKETQYPGIPRVETPLGYYRFVDVAHACCSMVAVSDASGAIDGVTNGHS